MKTNAEILKERYPSVSKFFTTDSTGITSSHANFVANMATQIAKDYSMPYVHARSLNKTITVNDKCISETDFSVPSIENVSKIGELYALTGWLREAIKEKDVIIESIKVASNSDVLNEPNYSDYTNGLKVVERPREPLFKRKDQNAKDTNVLNTGEHADFILNQAIASHIGLLIHEDSPIAKQRELLLSNHEDIIQEMKNGDISIAEFSPVIGFNDMYYALQNEYREAEKKNNYNKAKIRNLNSTAEQNALVVAKQKYEQELVAYNEYQAQSRLADSKYEQDVNVFNNTSRKLILELLGVFSAYKIVIPNILLDTYVEVSAKVGQDVE